MMLLSVILGLVIAWLILAFIGPRNISYYKPIPIQGAPIEMSCTDKMMVAVGLPTGNNTISNSPPPPPPPVTPTPATPPPVTPPPTQGGGPPAMTEPKEPAAEYSS